MQSRHRDFTQWRFTPTRRLLRRYTSGYHYFAAAAKWNLGTGAAAQHTFHTASENASMSFSFPVQVTAVPASLQVLAQGGNFLYSGASISIYKIN